MAWELTGPPHPEKRWRLAVAMIVMLGAAFVDVKWIGWSQREMNATFYNKSRMFGKWRERYPYGKGETDKLE